MVKWLEYPTHNQKVVSSNPGLTTALCVPEQLDTLLNLLQSTQLYKWVPASAGG